MSLKFIQQTGPYLTVPLLPNCILPHAYNNVGLASRPITNVICSSMHSHHQLRGMYSCHCVVYLLLLFQLETYKEVLKVHHQKRVAVTINIIGLMCDGQHKKMQNYFREQENRITDINMIEEITSLLYEYSKRRQLTLTHDNLPLIAESFQTLVELCLGNLENIEVILRKQILYIINYYLQIDINYITSTMVEGGNIDDKIQALKLKSAVVELLEAMLEKYSSESERFTKQIAEGLSSHALHDTMEEFYKLKDDKKLKAKGVNENARRALFKTVAVIHHLTQSGEYEYKFGECKYWFEFNVENTVNWFDFK